MQVQEIPDRPIDAGKLVVVDQYDGTIGGKTGAVNEIHQCRRMHMVAIDKGQIETQRRVQGNPLEKAQRIHGSGTLSAMFIIDSVGKTSVETTSRTISRQIEAQQNDLWLALEPPLDAHYGSQAEKNSCELILIWHEEHNDDRLDLVAPPEFVIP